MRANREFSRRGDVLRNLVQRWLGVHRLHMTRCLAALGLAGVPAPAARAGDSLWLGGSNNSNWSEPFNWSPLGAPQSTDTAYFTSNVAVRAIAEFNGGTTSVGALVFSGASSLGVGPYGLRGNVASTLNIGSILFVTPALNPSGGTNTGVSIDNLIVTSATIQIDSTCELGLSNSSSATTGQLLLNSGTFEANASIATADAISMTGTSVLNVDASALIGCNGLLNMAGTGVVNVHGHMRADTLQMTSAGSINVFSGGGMLLSGGSATISAGTMTIASGGEYLTLPGANAVTTFQNSGVFRPNGGQTLSGDSTLKALAGGKIIADDFYNVGYSTGDVNIATLVVDGGTSSFSAKAISNWGFGSLGNAKVTFSNSSVGTLTDLTVGGNLGQASISILSSAQLTTTGQTLIGTSAGTSNSVAVTANGGTLVFGGPTTVRNGGRLTLTTGGVKFQNDATISTGSSFQWSGGSLDISSGKTFNVAGGTFGISTAGGNGLPSGVTLKITNDGGANGGTGGQFSNNSYFDIAGSGASSGTLLVDGAGSKITANGTSDYGNLPNAVATVTFSNSGAGTYSGLRLGANGGVAFLNLDSNGQLNTSSLTAGNASVSPPPVAIVRVEGGVLSNIGTASFLKGSTLALSSGTLALLGNTTFSTGASLGQTGGAFYMPEDSTLSIEGGGTASILKNSIPDHSTVRVTGGGKLTVGDFLDIAELGGDGTLLVDGGTSNFAVVPSTVGQSSVWGYGAGLTADVTFSNGATGDLSKGLTVAPALAGGTARIKVLSGAKLSLPNLATGAAGGGSATITVAGGTLTTAGTASFGDTTLLDFEVGSINFGGDTTFSTGSTFNCSDGNWDNAPGTTLAFDGGIGSFTFAGHSLSTGSTLRVASAGTVNSAYFDIPTGTMSVQDSGSSFTAGSVTYWGLSLGDSATITFSNFGVGTYNGGLKIGAGGGAALVNLLSSAQLNTASMIVGGGTHSDGVTLNVNGGTLNVIGPASFQNGATLNLRDGGMILGGDATFSAGSTLNWSGGTLGTAAGKTLAFDGGVGSFSVFFGGAGLSNGSTLRIAGGTLVTNGFVDIGNSSDGGATGTMLVDGGSFTSTPAGSVDFSAWGEQTGDAATITFSNSGVGSFNAGLHIGAVGGAATVNLLSSARLNTASLLMGNASGPSDGVNMTINSASLTVIGNGTMNGGSTITLQSGSADFRSNLVMNSLSRINYNGGSLSVKGNLNLNSSARVFLSSGRDKTLRVGTAFVGTGLVMSNNSKLDLADNTLLIGYTGTSPLPIIRTYLLTGRAGGPWTGGQLTSSAAAAVFADPMNLHKTALGYVDNAFGFQQIQVKYAYMGDANLDGTVNALDFNAVASNFGGSSKFWFTGDFNYDGTTDTSDFTALASNFNQTLMLSAPPLGTIVPEPVSMTLLALISVLAMFRRRRCPFPSTGDQGLPAQPFADAAFASLL